MDSLYKEIGKRNEYIYIYQKNLSDEAIRETLNSCFYYESLYKFLKTFSGKAIELYIYIYLKLKRKNRMFCNKKSNNK